jgi:Ca-activated chloride channel family protein
MKNRLGKIKGLPTNLLVLLCLCLAVSSLGQAQSRQQRPIEKTPPAVETSRDPRILPVTLNLSVMDSSNRPAEGVTREQIEIFENGVAQTVSRFSNRTGPLSYGLVIDASGSLRQYQDQMLKLAQAVIANTEIDEEAFIIKFVSSDNITLLRDWTSNRSRLYSALNDVYPEGGQSALVDALHTAIQHVSERRKSQTTERRYALVLISDGEDRASYYKLDQVLSLARTAGVQVFVVSLAEVIEKQSARIRAASFLDTVANETGGRVWPGLKMEPELIAAQISVERHAPYLVGYDSTNSSRDGSVRNIKVVVKQAEGGPKLSAVARPSYTAPRK